MPSYQDIYQRHADDYDALVGYEDAAGHLHAAVTALAQQASRVVELGCGTGRVTRIIAPHVARLDAFDAAGPMVAVARKRATTLGHDHAHFAVAEHAALPVADAVADLVIAGWAIAHAVSWHPDAWRAHVDAALGEMSRVAAPGATLVIIETLGTGGDPPAPPPALAPFYAHLASAAFACTTLVTDYRFPSPGEAERLCRFFFGDARGDAVRARGTASVQERTGLWLRRAPQPTQET